jgi:hypothetical protein
MNEWARLAGEVIAVGAGATAVMDVWLLLLKRLGIPTLNFALLGRWVGHVVRGRWFHDGMAKSAPVRNEMAVGWLAHYCIGIGFAVLHVAIFGVGWLASPALVPAVITGVATVVAPLFIMQPAMGSGIASMKTATPVRNCCKSLVNHGVFGVGIYLAAIFVRWI